MGMKRMMAWGCALMCAVLGMGTAWAAEPIRIGLMAPVTGAWASEGEEMKNIVNLLAEELNAKGGLLGRKIEVALEDDGGDPRTASLAAQRLATQGIVAVVGTYGSSVTEASQSIYDEASILQIATGSTSIRLSEKNLKYFFRTCPRDDDQGRVAAQTILKTGVKKVAILHDNTSYAKGLADASLPHLKKGGVEVVFFDALTPGERDFSAILTKMKSAGPELIFFTGYYPELGLILRQKKEINWTIPVIGGDATNNPDLVKIAGETAEGYYFISPPIPNDLPYEKTRAFLKNYGEKYEGTQPGSIWAVLAGDAFLSITDAIKATGSTDVNKMAQYLHKSEHKTSGLTGEIGFNTKGDRVGDVYRVYRVNKDGAFVLQEQ
jgi:branched-chain amino acid transport system substrate-binding protein